jgi:hypothetical protein
MPAPLVGAAAAIAARLAAKKVAQEAAKKAAKNKLGVSVRSKSVDAGTKRMVTKQNKAAESYKIKDLDKLEKGRAQRAAAKEAALAAAKKKTNKDMAKGAAAATGGIATGLVILEKAKSKSKPKPAPKKK